jgi:hypothetical protein
MTEPITFEECNQFISDHATMESYQRVKSADGGFYLRRISISTTKGRTTWTCTDYYRDGSQEELEQTICKLGKALYMVKQEGIV